MRKIGKKRKKGLIKALKECLTNMYKRVDGLSSQVDKRE